MSEKKCNLCYIRQITQPMRSAKSIREAAPYDNGVTKPPMGWSSWNCFRNNIDEQKIIDIAEAMVKTGLKDKGYVSLNLDDNWHSSMRDENGDLQGDLERFPNGIGNLISYLNGKGLKVGLYTSNGTLTCEDLPASFGNEERDAYRIARWGAEFFKYDFCHHHAFTSAAPLVSAIGLIKSGDSEERITVPVSEATLGGNAKYVKFPKLPSGGYVKGLDKNKGIIIFDGIEAEEGEYTLTIVTKKIGDKKERFIAVEVNDGDAEIITVPGCHKPNVYARVQCKITLNNGKNIIKLYNPLLNKADGYMYQYRYMGKMLKKATARVALESGKAERPITYSICEWGFNRPWEWGVTAGNQWRTTLDIRPWWIWMMLIYRRTVKLWKYSSKGHYNDPDMLEVGNGKLTFDQNKTHFSIWCMLNAPLILGNDLRKFIKEDGSVDENNEVLKIVTNENLIAVNQDEKGMQCKRVRSLPRADVLAKPLADGVAICFFNRTRFATSATFDINALAEDEYFDFVKCDGYTLRDLWTNETSASDGKLTVELPPYACKVYKIKY